MKLMKRYSSKEELENAMRSNLSLFNQYSSLRGEWKEHFQYSDMKKVYTIIIYETSIGAFHDDSLQGAYFHHGKTIFDTGLDLELLQEYFIISLDVFRENGYAKGDDILTMWLSFLATETISDAEYLIQKYPYLEEIYIEMSEYMYRQEEVLNMFSEALKIMDRNTVRYMMDEMQKKIKDQEVELSDTKSQFISYIISSKKKESSSKESAITEVMTQCGKTETEAKELVEKYW